MAVGQTLICGGVERFLTASAWNGTQGHSAWQVPLEGSLWSFVLLLQAAELLAVPSTGFSEQGPGAICSEENLKYFGLKKSKEVICYELRALLCRQVYFCISMYLM